MAEDDKSSSSSGAALTGDAPAACSDVAMLGAPTENGVSILRVREGHVEVGELRALEEGKPILGESVRLHAREDRPGLYNVETIARGPLAMQGPRAAPALPAARKGPAKVANDAYRSGWDSIFRTPGSGRPSGGDLPN